MKISFSKYHGLANDFLLMDYRDGTLLAQLTGPRIRSLCDRHTGIGADGILVRTKSEKADHRMVLYNGDGSKAEISGNGLRCFALFLRDQGYDVAHEFSVETGGGVQRVTITGEHTVESTMPAPQFGGGENPKVLILHARDAMFSVCPVNVGNPHGVIFGPKRDISFAETYGPVLERNEAFPQGANIQFVHVVDRITCDLVVWERGAGITLACGSGSVASACAGAALGHFDFDQPIAVRMPGGTLHITVSPDLKTIRQRGEATKVFAGEIEI